MTDPSEEAAYIEKLYEYGEQLNSAKDKSQVKRNIDLVYGGGSVGLMGLISHKMYNGGCHVIGKDVQSALQARLVGIKRWSPCSNVLEYDLQDLEIPIIMVVGKQVKAGIPVLVYSGDQDSVIPHRVWFEGQQVGGWTQVYGNILSFATVRGASHEAPFSQPERSLVLFKSFLEGRPLPEEF